MGDGVAGRALVEGDFETISLAAQANISLLVSQREPPPGKREASSTLSESGAGSHRHCRSKAGHRRESRTGPPESRWCAAGRAGGTTLAIGQPGEFSHEQPVGAESLGTSAATWRGMMRPWDPGQFHRPRDIGRERSPPRRDRRDAPQMRGQNLGTHARLERGARLALQALRDHERCNRNLSHRLRSHREEPRARAP